MVVERIGTIKNPLTIIAMFAAIAEISGTIVLPFISPANQATYVWFLIIFPILLIVLFFATLNFNHRVLYAPSDYKHEDNFLKSFHRATYVEKTLQVEAELAETIEMPTTQVEIEAPRSPKPTSAGDIQSVELSLSAKYAKAEELVFNKLGREFNRNILRDVRIDADTGRPYIFDGIVHDKGLTTVIEVKLLHRVSTMPIDIRITLRRIKDSVKFLPEAQRQHLRVLLVIVTEGAAENHVPNAGAIDRARVDVPFAFEVRYYALSELEKEALVEF